MNTSELKAAARTFGADLIGITPVSRIAGAPRSANVLSIFPQARSVIIVGCQIPRGTLGTGFTHTFENYGFRYVEDQTLAKTTYDLVIWIERHGFEGVPVFGYDAEAASKSELAVPVSPDKPAANVYVDLRIVAEACGLGMTGRNGLFITPEFGTRQRLAMLISDAELEGDPEREFDFCEGCAACLRACPAAAIQADSTHQVGRRTVYDILYKRCPLADCGAVSTDYGRFNTIERVNAACNRACLKSLEERNKLIGVATHAELTGI